MEISEEFLDQYTSNAGEAGEGTALAVRRYYRRRGLVEAQLGSAKAAGEFYCSRQ